MKKSLINFGISVNKQITRKIEGSITEQLRLYQDITQINLLLTDSPSLKSKITNCLPVAYKKAKSLIKQETPIDLKLLPMECPYTFEQIMNEEFYP